MSNENYHDAIDRTKKFLDKIDIRAFADSFDTNIYDLMGRLETSYADDPYLKDNVFEGYLFNWMGRSEFCEYLKERYGNGFETKETTTISYIFK